MIRGLFSATSGRSVLLAAAVGSAGKLSFSVAHSEGDDLKAFSPKEFRSFPIQKIETVSPNTKRFVFSLPSPKHEMGMEVASFILVKGPNDSKGKVVTRPYTPTSTNAEKGHFELMIKAYPGGHVTQYLHSLKVGDKVEVKGPLMKLKYTANMKKRIGMLAGGTGITPMLQVLHEIINNPADTTEVHLVFANNTEEDILLKKEIDEIVRKHPRVKVTYVVATPSKQWKGAKGFVSASIIRDAMPAPSDDTLIMVCGPPGFMKAVSGDKTPDYKQGPVEGLLRDLRYTESMVFKF